MKADRWKQVDELLEAAMEIEPSRRAQYLDEACEDDSSLRREVESLLAAYDEAGNFIEDAALDIAARRLAKDQTSLAIPRQIGPYKIDSILGAGGMGEVYLAEDTRLGRRVALKLLPAEFVENRDRVRRFEREARAASALSHPNILTIYEIGQAGGTHFIATEFIEGQTLRRKIADGAMEVNEALDVAIQIAAGLSAAHAAGIIHRDIKPENIMLRRDGYVKVLDFGLAKLTESDSTDETEGHLLSTMKTDPGRVMGTINYMSPEQALGYNVDHRTDIFSLGVVIYEIITGATPFKGETAAAIFDSILNRTPTAPTTLIPGLNAKLEKIIYQALEKNREARYETAADLQAELKHVRMGRESDRLRLDGEKPCIKPAIKPAIKKWALASLALVIAVSIWYLLRPSSDIAGTQSVSEITGLVKITDQTGEEIFPSLSPDDNLIAYASRASGNWDVYLQQVGGKSINLTPDSAVDDTQPAFSPDGKSIAFRSERQGGGLFVMGIKGENPRRIVDFGGHPAWSPDGKTIIFDTDTMINPGLRHSWPSAVWAIDIASGDTRLITKGDALQPQWSPDGRHIAYWGAKDGNRDIWIARADGSSPLQATYDPAIDWNPVWSPDGRYIYFLSNRSGSMSVWRMRLDEDLENAPESPEAVSPTSANYLHLSLSGDGKRLACAQATSTSNLQKVSFDPVAETTVGTAQWVLRGSILVEDPSLSPDEESIAFSCTLQNQSDLYVVKSDGTERQNLTDDQYNDSLPHWSPDGRRIAFRSSRSGNPEIWVIDRDGSNLRQVTHDNGARSIFAIWSPDGKRLIYNIRSHGAFLIEAEKSWSEQRPQPLPAMKDPNFYFWARAWSPDGQRVAGWLGGDGEISGIVVYSFEKQQYEQLTDIGYAPVWLSDNRRLMFNHGSSLYLLDTATKRYREILSLAPNRAGICLVSKDDNTIYFAVESAESDICLLAIEP